MLGVLALAWVLVYVGIVKGIKSSGKVMYFATLFPYFVLVIFFFRGVTLDGAVNGVVYMLKPNVCFLNISLSRVLKILELAVAVDHNTC